MIACKVLKFEFNSSFVFQRDFVLCVLCLILAHRLYACEIVGV